jgi:hypothetical protein
VGKGDIHKSHHLDGLEKNILFVRSLDIAITKDPSITPRVKSFKPKEEEGRLKLILLQCRELTVLNTNSVYEELFEVLVNNRRTIASFQLRSDANHQYMLRLWHVLGDDTDARSMGNLRHLDLKRVEIPGDGSDPALHLAFIKLCCRLETLDCYCCPMRDWTPPVEDTQQTSLALKEVTLTGMLDMIADDAPFLKRCKMKSIYEI